MMGSVAMVTVIFVDVIESSSIPVVRIYVYAPRWPVTMETTSNVVVVGGFCGHYSTRVCD